MLCSSDMIFPRLNALSLWLLFQSLIIISLAVLIDGGVNAGWTFYVPLSIILYIILIIYPSVINSRYRTDIIWPVIVTKGHILYRIISINFLSSLLFINLISNQNSYITMLVNIKYYPLSWFMVTVVILISPIVIFNSIDLVK